MGYRRGSVYYFADASETGLDEIPIGYQIMERATGSSFLLTDKTGITSTTTITEAIDSELISLIGPDVLSGPSITISNTVVEGNTVQGQIDDFDALATYFISATNGTITNYNATTGTFDYTAQEISDYSNKADSIEILTVFDASMLLPLEDL